MVREGMVPAAKAALSGLDARGAFWLELARSVICKFQKCPTETKTEATGAAQKTEATGAAQKTEATGAAQKTLVSEALWENPWGTREKVGFIVGDLAPAKVLGHGTFGRVYLCTLPSGATVIEAAGATVQSLAVKIVPRECRPVEGTDMEVRILQRLQGNPEIVQLIVACRSPFHDTLVFPAYDGTLHDMFLRGEIKRPVISKNMGQLLRALSILATHFVVHRDIKPRNILVRDNEPLAVVLSDFGSGVFLAEELEGGALRDDVCTRGYEAPEMLWRLPYGCSSDVWSLAVVMTEAATGHHPFYFDDATTRQSVLRRIYQSCIDPDGAGDGFAAWNKNKSLECRERPRPEFLANSLVRRSSTDFVPILTSMLKVNVSCRASSPHLLKKYAHLLH